VAFEIAQIYWLVRDILDPWRQLGKLRSEEALECVGGYLTIVATSGILFVVVLLKLKAIVQQIRVICAKITSSGSN